MQRLIWMMSISILCFLILPVTAQETSDCYTTAKAHYDARTYEAAIEPFTCAIEADDENTKNALLYRGISYNRLKRYDEALLDLDKYIEKTPSGILAFYERAESHQELDDIPRAIEDLNAAEALYIGIPADQQAPYLGLYRNILDRRGIYKLLNDHFVEAIEDFDQYIALYDGEYPTWIYSTFYNRGFAYNRLGDQEAAISNFLQAIEFNPQYAAAWNQLAGLYFSRNEVDLAIEAYTQAISSYPETNQNAIANSSYSRGRLYYGLGQYEDTIADMETVVAITGDAATNARYLLGISLLMADKEEALAHEQFEKMLDYAETLEDKTTRFYFEILGLGYEGLKQFESAGENYFEALKLYHDDITPVEIEADTQSITLSTPFEMNHSIELDLEAGDTLTVTIKGSRYSPGVTVVLLSPEGEALNGSWQTWIVSDATVTITAETAGIYTLLLGSISTAVGDIYVEWMIE